MTIAIVGAGTWGTALAVVLSNAGREVRLWARSPDLAAELTRTRRNHRYLPGVSLGESVEVTPDLPGCVRASSLVVLTVPTHGIREVARAMADALPPGVSVVSGAKGFEEETGATMTRLLAQEFGTRHPTVALSGPNIASELARGLPGATVVASADSGAAAAVRDALTGPQLRVYSNPDVIGVEYGGALKNVVALAAGICDGMAAGDNAKAALITRGIAEMGRLGVAAGADPITFAGLTGMGDCVVTCTSPHSRNRSLGEAIGRGATLAEGLEGRHTVAEGVAATRAGRLLARRAVVEMPLLEAVHAVLFEDCSLSEIAVGLMARGARDELEELRLPHQPAGVGGGPEW
ncbi:MAG: NAD(P)H-dependent glycerol-3-phosphate dehydrogenase [Candidatus Dormibacteria bacterium]